MSYKTTSTGITKISILNEITEIEIFEYYLGIRVQLNINIVSPTILRSDDKSPGCAFWYNGEKIKYIDRSKGINEDCFGIVKLIHGGNFNDTLLRIASDFNLFGRTPITTYKKDVSQDSNFIPLGKLKLEKKVFQYQIKDWSLVDKKYWKERYLDSRILNEWKVRSISSAFINGRCIYVYEPTDVGYVYEFDDGTVQFYFPFRNKSSKNKKFITNSNIILGWEKLPKSGENVIISKSYKDIILLSELYGFPSVAPIGEGAFQKDI